MLTRCLKLLHGRKGVMANTDRMVGEIPESKILDLYAGIYLPKFKQVWLPVYSPTSGHFSQVRLELRKTDHPQNGDEVLHLAYSKTGNCIMIVRKMVDDKETSCGLFTIDRVLIKIENPDGVKKANKVIEKFLSDG